ncbi:gag-pol, partial [Mucuna pruriens]
MWQHLNFHQRHLGSTRKNSRAMPNTTYRMIPTFGDSTVIKLFVGAFLTSRSIQSSSSATQHLEAATMYQLGLLGKCLIAGSIGPLFLEMLISIDFMGPFPVSNGYSYILLAVDYVSRWVETIATKTNDAKVVVDFLKSNIFRRFGVPKALISDQGNHFCNRAMASLLHKYGMVHKAATTYHPQTND